ncbi:MAG: ribonuclease P protein subunit [Thermoproteota archaeon]|jgi:ribonuclease P protein subunit POP4|uniref:Ribonuclease P protein component 1 n=1 Tax=Candidatus Methanodesulfokora washburnensis TaxID=2478471 RepID=A0A429GQS9_9CREN|nr:ribonuclease P protein subunit [Candidatus Methanodesulfokores washburnensis]RSN76228.1 ribonuclease P protein subunit [Candidatus Methanodesulfokores washburnensis]RZN62059.1 MAG: ribonuclease P protein subunit [Candidatus Methanodesulfokores washburnensis]TDA38811.1 MAG: ribonuclease P protein subunit [Candidatus Korarchaeota archaeon]
MRKGSNILYHEIIGLEVEVVFSPNPYEIGMRGRVVDETMNLLILDTRRGRKKVEKRDRVFRMKLDDGVFDVYGTKLIGRPEERVKRI